jgi:hypothetical protein
MGGGSSKSTCDGPGFAVCLRTLISIEVDTKGSLTKPLDDVYRRILSDAVDADRRESDEIALTKQILAAVLTVGQPLSVASLGGLLGVPAWQVRAMLDRGQRGHVSKLGVIRLTAQRPEARCDCTSSWVRRYLIVIMANFMEKQQPIDLVLGYVMYQN